MKKRKGLKIIAATIACIFNLFVCFTGVMAWFAANQRNTANEMQITAGTHELNLNFKVYKYVEDEKAVIEVTDRNDRLTLQKYDSVFTERNENTPIIVEFLLSGSVLENNMPIDIISSLSNIQAPYYLSDIIRLKLAPLEVEATTISELYEEVVGELENSSIPEIKFKNGQTKVSEVTYTLSNYSEYVTGAGLKMYLMLDYSEQLIGEYLEENVTDITDLSNIPFTNDLSEINCVTHES